jgi:hypothetical protein
MEAGKQVTPANEASGPDVRVDAADDDELGESSAEATPRPQPRKAPRFFRPIRTAEPPAAPVPAATVPASPSATSTPADVSASGGITAKQAPTAARSARPAATPPSVPSATSASGAPSQPIAPHEAPSKPDLLIAVDRLRTQLGNLSLTLDLDGAEPARQEREATIRQLDDYLLPRLRRRDAPLLAVIGGSTGAGKSTLTNSLVRREVTRSGVLRPTTRSPVLIHHPYDSGAFLSQRILPGLTRVTSEAPEPLQPIDANAPRITGLRLVPHDGLPPGMAIIDAPDIDSLVDTNRELAVQLLQAADLWIFVTTASRYADAMPWEMLKQAADRGVAVAVVLDRVPPESLADLRVHLATRLRDRGLAGAPLFAIPESPRDENGFLPQDVVAPLQQWLRRVAGDERSRAVIAERTLKGVLASLSGRIGPLADAADAQYRGWEQLRADLDDVFAPVRERLLPGLVDGSLVNGEVRARWQDFMADGGFARRLDGGSGGVVERVGNAVRRDVEAGEPIDVPVTDAIVDAVRASTWAAAEELRTRWRAHPYGAALLQAKGEDATATDAGPEVGRLIRDWRAGVSSRIQVAVEEAERAGKGRGVNLQTAADVLFVVTLDQPADEGESPADVTVSAARRVVATFLGEESVNSLLADARSDLQGRAADILEAERTRLEKLLLTGPALAGRGESLRAAAALVDEARR